MSKITFFSENFTQLITLFTLSFPGSLCTLSNPTGVQPFFFSFSSSSSHWYHCLSAFFPRCLIFQQKINRRDDWHWLSIKNGFFLLTLYLLTNPLRYFVYILLHAEGVIPRQYCYRNTATAIWPESSMLVVFSFSESTRRQKTLW